MDGLQPHTLCSQLRKVINVGKTRETPALKNVKRARLLALTPPQTLKGPILKAIRVFYFLYMDAEKCALFLVLYVLCLN